MAYIALQRADRSLIFRYLLISQLLQRLKNVAINASSYDIIIIDSLELLGRKTYDIDYVR